MKTVSYTHLDVYKRQVLSCALCWSLAKGDGDMRLDKFLKVSRLIKRRTVANEACDAGRVFVNGSVAVSYTHLGEFELAFLKYFEYIYHWAEAAVAALDDTGYEKLYEESLENGSLVHGDYNYHNILVTPEGLATTNFEKFKKNISVEDLYYYLRKAMEKHEWNLKLCDGILNAYSAVRPISEQEEQYMKVRLILSLIHILMNLPPRYLKASR